MQESGPVWDIWVRAGHWTLVAAIAFQWYSGEDVALIEAHATVGILIFGWVGFRVIWGFAGPEYARFRSFTPTHLKALTASVKRLFNRESEPTPGHTLTGGLGVYALLGLMGMAALTGMASTDDIFFDGPLVPVLNRTLVDWASFSHPLITQTVLIVAGLHITAIAWHTFAIKEPLIAGMLHGRKPLRGKHLNTPRADSRRVKLQGGLLLTICLAASYGLFAVFLGGVS